MSSHHIVRENQEPALVVVDVADVPVPVIQELLEWSPQIIVCERALEEVLKWDIKLDVVIVPEHKRSQWLAALQHQAPVKVLTHAAHEAPWTTAFYLLKSLNQKSVQVIGLRPSEAGHLPDGLEISCLHKNVRWTYQSTGVFEKWLPAGVRLEVLGVDVVISGLCEEGVTARQGLVRVTGSSPYWVGEHLQATTA
ncbi:MAG: hypothetical protein RMK43_10000 [Cyclobacteriaceae bacterium]|nr:hypothetical protein [Cyclobacteriaceae bacterium]